MAVFELGCLRRLRRLSLMRVPKVTDLAIYALAEQATQLERLHLSYCEQLSLESVHVLLQKLDHFQHLTATGIPAFRRKGVQRFSDVPPPVRYNLLSYDRYHVYSCSP
jgi:F-box and leucine-rich repeat protein GRR1